MIIHSRCMSLWNCWEIFLILFSDIDRLTHLMHTQTADSEELTRRVFGQKSKYGSPLEITLDKQGHQSCSQGSEQYLDLKIKEGNTFCTSSEIGKLKDLYPKVVLCDIAKNGVSLSQDCSYNLPDVLKTKVIRCFKQKMRAIYRFEPSCLGYKAHKNENEAAAKNRPCCPSVQSERSICLSWRGTEHQKHLRECTDAQTFPRHTTCSFPQELTSEDSTARSASFSAGEQFHMVGGCGREMGDGGAGEDSRTGFPLKGPDDLTEKRIKLGDSVKKGTLSSTPDFENAAAARSGCGDREETCSWGPDESQSSAEYALGNSTSLAVAVNENRFCEETNTSEARTLLKMFSQNDNGDMDDTESFTCQRVQAYVKKSFFSCARTDMPWPFSNRLQNPALHAVKPVCPTELIDPPDNSKSPRNRNEPDTFRNSTNGSLSKAPKCFFSNPAVHEPQQNGKQDSERGEGSETQSNRENHDHMSVCSPESTNVELAPHLIVAGRSQAGPASDGTDLSAVSTSASLLPDSAPQTDSAASTPPPSVLGLDDWGSATTLSSLSSHSTASASSFQQKELTSVYAADASFSSCLVRIVEKFRSEKSQRTCAAPFSPSHSTDSSESCDSLPPLPQDTNEHRMELADTTPPKLEPYFHTSPIHPYLTKDKLSECVLRTNGYLFTEFSLPPILSPISSPRAPSKGEPLAPRQSCSDEEERIQTTTCSHVESNRCDVSEIVNARCETSTDNAEEVIPGLKGVSASFTRAVPPSETRPFIHNSEDFDNNAEQSQTSEEDTPDPEVWTAQPPGVLLERQSSCSSNDDDSRAAGSSSFASSPAGETEQTNTKAVGDLRQGVLDEFSAYERDILLIGVTQDDPELFENVPQESLINLGPTRTWETTQTPAPLPRSQGPSSALVQRLVPRCGLSLMDRVFPC